MSMTLDAAGIEYAHWPVTSDVTLNNPPQARVAGVLHPTEWAAAATGNTRVCRLLVQGPTATGGGVVLAAGRNALALVITDTPEVVIRDAGSIYVTA